MAKQNKRLDSRKSAAEINGNATRLLAGEPKKRKGLVTGFEASSNPNRRKIIETTATAAATSLNIQAPDAGKSSSEETRKPNVPNEAGGETLVTDRLSGEIE